MTKVTYDSLGLDFTFTVPESVEEYNKSAPLRVNPVLEDAIDNVVYRSNLAKSRGEFVDAVEALTKIERKVEVSTGKSGKTITKYLETEKDYFDRVVLSNASRDSVTEEAARLAFQSLADKIASGILWDAAVKEAGGKAKKATKESTAIVADLRKNGKFDAAAAKLAAQYGTAVPTEDEALALLVAEHLRRERAKAEAAATLALAAM